MPVAGVVAKLDAPPKVKGESTGGCVNDATNVMGHLRHREAAYLYLLRSPPLLELDYRQTWKL